MINMVTKDWKIKQLEIPQNPKNLGKNFHFKMLIIFFNNFLLILEIKMMVFLIFLEKKIVYLKILVILEILEIKNLENFQFFQLNKKVVTLEKETDLVKVLRNQQLLKTVKK